MLYIASALASTAVSHSLLLESTASDDISATPQLSLVLAKGNRLEIHDVSASGLTEKCELDVWGQIVGLAKAPWDNAVKSFFVVLTDAPLARLILLAYDRSAATPVIETVLTLNLSPPSRSSRHAEFFTGLITCPEHNLVIASLWTGVLSVATVGLPVKKGSRKESISGKGQGSVELRDSYNLNIKEHNLVSLAFVPSSHALPMLAFLSLSPTRTQVVQLRTLTNAQQLLTDLSELKTVSADVCPAARHVLGLPTGLVIVGDEFTSFYEIASRTASTRLGSSPEAVVKKRKGSVGGSFASVMSKNHADAGEVWDMKGSFRLRQGFGTVLASAVLTATADQATVLIGDEFGKMSALSFNRTGGGVPAGKSQLTNLGQTSPPTSITYLDAGYVFVGSHCGDSQIIHIDSAAAGSSSAAVSASQPPVNVMSSPESIRSSPRKGKGKARSSDAFDQQEVIELEPGKQHSDVVDLMMNLAPVNDFCIIEEEGGSVSKIVTASGASTSNSLRVVRSGVGLETKLTVHGIADVRNVWPLSSDKIRGFDDLLLVSTSSRTLLLEISADGSSVSQADLKKYPGLQTQCRTLTAGQTHINGHYIQVTERQVVLISLEEGNVYTSDTTIVTAALDDMLVIGESSKKVKVLHLDRLDVLHEITLEEEPSALALTLRDPTLLAVACWDGSLALYQTDGLIPVLARTEDGDVDMDAETPTASSSAPICTHLSSYGASLAFHKMKTSAGKEHLQLLVGQGNGSLLHFGVEQLEGGFSRLSEPSAASLGPSPVRLTPSRGFDGLEQNLVIALSEKLTLLFEDRDRLAQSSISRPDLTSAAAMQVPGLGSCLVIAAQEALTFTRVTSLKKLHVQKTDLGDKSPMKIAHLPRSNLLGLGILQSSLDVATGDMLELGYFELRDATTLASLGQFLLEPTESVTALSVLSLAGRTFFAVGTAFDAAEGNMNNVQRGRLLFLAATFSHDDQTWSITSEAELKLAGPVYAVQVVRGRFVALASQNKITVYDFTAGSGGAAGFKEISTWGSAFVAEHLDVLPAGPDSGELPSTLIVGDSMRSVSTLHVSEAGVIGAEKRDLSTHWVTGLHPVKDGGQAVIISDSNYNLLTLRLGEQIENAARFGLHEHLTRFRAGSVAASAAVDPEIVSPDVVFATAAGRIGIVSELGTASTRILDDLQRNLEQHLKGPGELDYSNYRKAQLELGSKPSVGFIDGDFVQRFLSLPADEQMQVLAGRGAHDMVAGSDGKAVDRSEVLRILEAVGQLH